MTILAGMRLKSQTPEWLWDDPCMAATEVVMHVLAVCRKHDVEPVGTLTVTTATSRFDDDEAVRWEFRPEATA